MEHGNDAWNGRPVASTAATTKPAGAPSPAKGSWALVNCGAYGVRPRRVQGKFSPGGPDRAARF